MLSRPSHGSRSQAIALLDPTYCVAIEDSRWGLESAGAAGLRRVAVANTYSAEEWNRRLVVAGLAELTLDALDALCESPPVVRAMPRRSMVP